MTTAPAAGEAEAGDHGLPHGLLRYVWQEGTRQQLWLCLMAGVDGGAG